MTLEFVVQHFIFSHQQGLCQDKYKVVGDVTYERAVFNADACKDLERILKVIRNSIHDELSLYAYEAQLSRYVMTIKYRSFHPHHYHLSFHPHHYHSSTSKRRRRATWALEHWANTCSLLDWIYVNFII